MKTMCDDAPDLVILVQLKHRIPGRIGMEEDFALCDFDPLEQQVLPNAHNDNLVVGNGECPVNHDHVLISDTGSGHGVATHAEKKSRQRMGNHKVMDVEGRFEVIIAGAWKPGIHRLGPEKHPRFRLVFTHTCLLLWICCSRVRNVTYRVSNDEIAKHIELMFHLYCEKVYLKNKQSVKCFEEVKEAVAVFFQAKARKILLVGDAEAESLGIDVSFMTMAPLHA